ncbi:MAG TPA: hypothetical protein VFC19_26175 [Candidatus Limnocylindrales bacterium]|nr:hypothetical protein [Candidatus Limnocylindrales bacterium]
MRSISPGRIALHTLGTARHAHAHRCRPDPGHHPHHFERALIKLGARDRAQLVVFAYQSGIPVPTL